MESLFAVVDVYYVSQLHDNDAVATVGLTESVLTLIYSLAMGLSMGATAMVARRVGERDIKAAQVAAMQAIYIGLGLSLLITVAGVFFSEDILRLMGASETLIENNSGYTRWMFTGNITIMLLFLINGVFRGAGNASIAMRALLLANGLNIILDPVFIFGFGPVPAYGVEGAAIATNIGRGTGILFQLYHLFRGKSLIKLHGGKFRRCVGYHLAANKSLCWGYRPVLDRFCKLDFPGAHTFGFWEYCRCRVHHSDSRNCFCYSAGLGYGKCSGYVGWTKPGRRPSRKSGKVGMENGFFQHGFFSAGDFGILQPCTIYYSTVHER